MDNFIGYDEIYADEQQQLIAEEFKRLKGHHYLEHAGATLYSETQICKIASLLSENLYANPHARNFSSKLTEDAIDIVRFELLSHFNTNPEEYSVIFTSGATASLKLIGENFCYGNGSLAYLQDNHTSVLGMRGYAPESRCIKIDEAFNVLSNKVTNVRDNINTCDNCLFVYPAQSNFNGTKYPFEWIDCVKRGGFNDNFNWFVVLDAASYVATNNLDLSKFKPDFVTLSFYKIFGYPTGLGALLVKNKSAQVLRKSYFGGGTVLMALSLENLSIPRPVLHEKFEDGTVDFLSILAIKQGFEAIQRVGLNFNTISKHTFSLARYLYRNLLCLHHSNENPVVVLYHSTVFEDEDSQGGIVNFNVLRDNKEFVGYSEVLHFANLYHVHLRTGCFCNPGACQHFLNLSSEDVKRHFEAGHVCGDQHDLVDGYPTGSVRVSFGYMSTKDDADKLLEMIKNCFVSKPIIKLPTQWNLLQEKYWAIFCSKKNDNGTIELGREVAYSTHQGIFLDAIFLYPIKSCGAFSATDKWCLTSTGLKYDREWMIVNSMGVCVTQKHNKKLCLIKPLVDMKRNILTLTFSGCDRSVSVPLNAADGSQKNVSLCQSKVCGDQVQGCDCGEEVAQWLSEVLKTPGLRLLQQYANNEESPGRTLKNNENLQLSLANKAQYLMVNTSSVNWLKSKVLENGLDESLESIIQRFRPNFVVSFQKPFEENDYDEFLFGDIKFEAGGKCTRCQMICIDQMSGNFSKEPLQTLSKEFKGKIAFGVYLNKCDLKMSRELVVGAKVSGRNNFKLSM